MARTNLTRVLRAALLPASFFWAAHRFATRLPLADALQDGIHNRLRYSETALPELLEDGPGEAISPLCLAAPTTAALPYSTCCHTFRATGITTYLQNGGTLEHAQTIANHESPRTTKLYDRTREELSLKRDRENQNLKFTLVGMSRRVRTPAPNLTNGQSCHLHENPRVAGSSR
jgi:hypothetical protein